MTVVPTTSQSLKRPHPEMHIPLPAGEGGLPKDSYANCDQVTTIDKELLDSTRGAIGKVIALSYRIAILNGIRRAVADPTV